MSKFFVVRRPGNNSRKIYVNIDRIEAIYPEEYKLMIVGGQLIGAEKEDLDNLIHMLKTQGKIENDDDTPAIGTGYVCDGCLFFEDGVCMSSAPCDLKKVGEKHE